MNWLETFRTGWDAIRSHRLRSGLTMLGILIGIAAVVLTVGLGLGSQQEVGAQISSLGSNLLIVSPGSSTTTGGVRGGFGSASTLTIGDADALASPVAAPDIKAVAPIKNSSLSLTAGTTNWTTTVVGTSPSWLDVRARTLAAGRFLTDQDDADVAAVTVLGSETATELFGSTDVVGRTVTINGIEFSVVGVLDAGGFRCLGEPRRPGAGAAVDVGQPAGRRVQPERRVDDLPRGAVGRRAVRRLPGGAGAAAQPAPVAPRSRPPTSPSARQQSLLATATSVSKTLTILLTGIAALSLLVGGIGVMNIMLVSVTERTREIGLRKALGAPPTAIRRQFLVEAVVLGLAGGLLGAALGIAGAKILPGLLDTTIVISPTAVLGSIAIAVGHRHRLRRLPGHPGRPDGPHRRAAQRMTPAYAR